MEIATVEPKRKSASGLKVWFMEARPQYLLLPVVLVFVGTAVAWQNDGMLHMGNAILALLGLVLCHVSVNVLNDYFDYKSGVDLKTIKTPFSGGSGILPAGLLKSKQALWYGLICFVLAVPIGVYFSIIKGWQLLPLLALGAICVLLYTQVILKTDFPEWSPGMGLGILPVLGAYFVQTGFYSWHALVASVPSGLLVLNLLLLNEFPDIEADKIANKRTLPIRIGGKNAAIVYSAFEILVYLWVIGAVIFGQMPVYCLIALLTLPFAIHAIRGSFNYKDLNKILPAMGSNVMAVLLTQALIGVGYILAAVL
ncbi:MAG TPA: prenyltransferase [Caldisericia bacterium]|nr:prenyltransferase [Caldisericia bacterium]HPL89305.1 prenyltransferase [Caldisericia bacterium]